MCSGEIRESGPGNPDLRQGPSAASVPTATDVMLPGPYDPTPPRSTAAPAIRGPLRSMVIRRLAHRILVDGLRPRQAAAALGLTRDQLYSMMESADFRRERERIERRADETANEVAAVLVDAALEAAEALRELIGSENRRVALAAARDVLDRIGLRRIRGA